MKCLLLILFTAQISFAQLAFLQSNSKIFENDKLLNNSPGPAQAPEYIPGSGEEKSATLAALYSFLLPGMGELYVGNYSSGKYFTIAEGALWITLAGFDGYGRWVRNDARNYASQHAGFLIAGQDNQYYVDIGDYNTIRDYNDDMLRKRNPYKVYADNFTYGWNWDSKTNREHYRDLRVSSDQAFNNVSFVAAAIAVNHLVSAVNAVMSARSHNAKLQQTGYLDIKAKVLGGLTHPHGIMVSFSKTF